MHTNSISPNNYTFPLILKSLADLKDVKSGQSVHTQVVKLGHLNDIYVQNSLLNLYASSGDVFLCRRVFDEMPLRDVVSWTVMINGYRVSGRFDYALLTFEQMQFSGVVPNRVTMVNALAACSAFGALDTGVWIHDFITRNGWYLDVRIGTCLIDMYGKCGRVEQGLSVFRKMKETNVFTWNALIKGFALVKCGEEAVRWFYRMEEVGTKPDEVTLIAVLCACVHSGLVQRGREIFLFLANGRYGFSPGAKHYACMVDLFARSGCLMEAQKVINEMPCLPTKSVWGALFAGCRAHGNLELSEFAAWQLIELEPENSGYYVVLSNLYADMGRWSEVEEVRWLMKERGLKKDSGSSSVQFESQKLVYELLA